MGFISKTFRAHFAQCFRGFRAHKVITRLHSRRTFSDRQSKFRPPLVNATAPIISRRPAADPSPLHNHAPSLCDDQSGADPARRAARATMATSTVGSSSTFAVSRQPSASSHQLPASSFQPSIRQPSAVSPSLQPCPSPERREATYKPSEPFSRLLTRPARGKQPQTPQPFAWPDPAREATQNPPAATLKVINIPVDNLLITC